MPCALLLSPDDQAVSAITGVLEEMSVTCERPLDGVSAAQKLNSRSFDLVLVDCENLPAAKLIFDVCRRGKNGHNPVPIAIVDGRAGLPTAFRLGAELILTKPVAKDQARTTIRTAVSRVRKDVPANESVPAPSASTSASVSSAAAAEERAHAAAASPQRTRLEESAPRFVQNAGSIADSPAAVAATSAVPAPTAKMHSAVDEIDARSTSPKLNPQPGSFSAPSFSETSGSETSSDRTAAISPKTARPTKPSDDPVLAELEREDLEESGLDKTAANQTATESGAPIFSSYQEGRQKRRGPLAALLMLALACGGFYAAWTYQPGFRAIVQPQVDRALALARTAHLPQSAPWAPASNLAQPVAQLAPATTSSPAPGPPTDLNRTPLTAPDSEASSAPGTVTTPAAAQPAANPGTAVPPATSGATTAAAPVAGKPEANRPSASTADDKGEKKDAAVVVPSNAQLPAESSAIILSSRGAERRLAQSVPPRYPAEARSGEAQGTVVLKVVVDENGKVAGLRLVEGNAVLATAAIQAVKQWRYRPYVREGKTVPFQTIVIVDFQRP